MKKVQGRKILGIDGNWEHILDKHGLTESEVVSIFSNKVLRPFKNKKSGSAEYMAMGKTFTGREIRVCYSWDDEKKGWIWIHTAF